MNRDALTPVLVVSAVTIFLTSLLATTLEQSTQLHAVVPAAVENGGLAVVLVGLFLLFEMLSYDRYVEKGRRRILVDAVLMFAAGAVGTAIVFGLFEAASVDAATVELGGLAVEPGQTLSAFVAFFAAYVLFFNRNRDCYARQSAS